MSRFTCVGSNLQEPFDEGFGKHQTLAAHCSGEGLLVTSRYEHIDWLDRLIRLGREP